MWKLSIVKSIADATSDLAWWGLLWQGGRPAAAPDSCFPLCSPLLIALRRFMLVMKWSRLTGKLWLDGNWKIWWQSCERILLELGCCLRNALLALFISLLLHWRTCAGNPLWCRPVLHQLQLSPQKAPWIPHWRRRSRPFWICTYPLHQLFHIRLEMKRGVLCMEEATNAVSHYPGPRVLSLPILFWIRRAEDEGLLLLIQISCLGIPWK